MNQLPSTISAVRAFLSRLAIALAIVFCFVLLSRAGGPKYVAGTTYFISTVTGQPLIWGQGQVTYYTDQGDLSPLLLNADANAFVANAFSLWTAVPTAALAVSAGGQLAEDVSGSNVTRNSDGTLTMPADIQPTAITTPVGIVYDYDGSVTDALLAPAPETPANASTTPRSVESTTLTPALPFSMPWWSSTASAPSSLRSCPTWNTTCSACWAACSGWAGPS
jgi:hypothetical protein